MKKSILTLGLVLSLSILSFAQKVDSKASANANNKTSVGKNGAVLESGTQIAAQLQNSLDAKNARVGDQVILKATNNIKQNGQVVVEKGAKLFGKVTEVQQKAKGNGMSKISVVFDTLQQGNLTTPISATIVSLTQARANINDNADADIMSSSNTQTRSSSNNGGLLVGVTNTVGNVVNTTTNTVGQTVGGVTNTVGGTLKGIQISQSADASVNGSSTLSLQGGNLRLEKGTTLNLRLTESASLKTSN